jgi:hypothetical protein
LPADRIYCLDAIEVPPFISIRSESFCILRVALA